MAKKKKSQSQSTPSAPARKTAPAQQPQPATTEAEPVENAAPKPATPSFNQLPRVVSLVVLAIVVLFTGVLFFKVMAGFIVPLFLAAVLAVIFEPLHKWSIEKIPDQPYWSALLSTGLISILVLAPLAWIGWEAFYETRALVSDTREWVTGSEQVPPDESIANTDIDEPGALVEQSEDEVEEDTEEIRDDISLGANAEKIVQWIKQNIYSGFRVVSLLQEARELFANNVVQLGLTSIAALFSAGLGLAIMIIALYYFFADGPSIIKNLMRLSPLEDKYEFELLERFANVSRAVVVATLLSALVQGLLGGIGYWFVMPNGSPVFLLTVLTMLLAIVPFLGATAVWAPVAAWVFFLTPDDQGFWPGIGLAIYGFCIVSSADNVIKPLVLSGQSNLHPLLALLSVLGGIQFLGPIGILVGPMLVVFMQALLEMLRKEIDGLKEA